MSAPTWKPPGGLHMTYANSMRLKARSQLANLKKARNNTEKAHRNVMSKLTTNIHKLQIQINRMGLLTINKKARNNTRKNN